MVKSTFFTGQPIFNQLLQLIPRSVVMRVASHHQADRYCKRFNSYDHLLTMLYSIFNNCNSLREVTTGMLVWDTRLAHVGMRHFPRRSTISDAGRRRSAEVFEDIYYELYGRYQVFLSDSSKKKEASNLYIFDSTTISLFQEILRASGLSKADGRRKGGIKVHTLIRSDQDVPCMVRMSESAANDVKFLKDINLPKGSVIVFDKGYKDYKTYNRFSDESITWVTRLRNRTSYSVVADRPVKETHQKEGVIRDQEIILGHNHNKKSVKVRARLITYVDKQSGKEFEFLTNNFRMSPLTIAGIYQKRWQIEVLFKRLKQNYPLKYFLGDNENAIKIQIWCTLIADLLLKIVKTRHQTKWSFSNLASLVRIHLMTYINLSEFLKSPEKSLLRKMQREQGSDEGLLFKT
jgi:hypothetical protein